MDQIDDRLQDINNALRKLRFKFGKPYSRYRRILRHEKDKLHWEKMLYSLHMNGMEPTYSYKNYYAELF